MTEDQTFDVVVIGAGVSGLYMLHRLRELGLATKVIEAGTGVGGTWYWNRYPGARFDSESYSYGYSFDDDLLQEWEWTEHFSAQPENLRYLEHVADRFDLRRDIAFETRVVAAHYDEEVNRWTVHTDGGDRYRCRYLITAMGALSVPTLPAIEGRDTFAGPAFHTSDWPRQPFDLAGRRVGVIGTGATAVQLIPLVAEQAGQLTVFQRRPNWCAPLHNRPITADEQADIKARYREIFAQCNETFAHFLHDSDRRKALEVDEEERLALYEKLWAEPGFGIWMANFRDVLVNEEANATLSAFAADKIRERVDDPELAEKLIPTDHGFGTRRVPMETNYYETYNRPDVTLVDLMTDPIREITPDGVVTDAGLHELDVIIYATGFDAVTGAFDRIDFRGAGGMSLADKWADGPVTFLGMTVGGFPNLFTLVGPHNASTFCNMPRCIEQNVDWVTDLVRHLEAEGVVRCEPTAAAERAWTDHVHETAERMLLSRVNSWFMGVNDNLGRTERRFLLYAGGGPQFRERCDEVAADGYAGLVLT